MEADKDERQLVLIFNEKRNRLLAKVGRLRHLPLGMSPGRADGIVELLQRLLLLSRQETDLDATTLECVAQMTAISARIEGRKSVKERTVQNWRADAESIGVLEADVRSQDYGGSEWNRFEIRIYRIDQIISDGFAEPTTAGRKQKSVAGKGRKRVETGGNDFHPRGGNRFHPIYGHVLTSKENLPPPPEQCAPDYASSEESAAAEIGEKCESGQPVQTATTWPDASTSVVHARSTAPIAVRPKLSDHPLWSSAEGRAAIAKAEAVGIEKMEGLLYVATQHGYGPSALTELCDEYLANKSKFTKPGAIFDRLRTGSWPASGVVPIAEARQREQARLATEAAKDRERQRTRIIRDGRAAEATDEQINAVLRKYGFPEL